MKKFISIFLVLGLVILPLNGCFGGGDTEEVEIVYETFEGTLKSLGGIKVSKSATHLLQTEDGDIFYVYSEKFDLDDDKYLGNRVEAYGEVTEASDKGKDVLKITKLDVLEIEEEEVEEIIEQVYSDQSLGFYWNILSDWDINRLSNAVKFTLPLSETEDGEESTLDADYITITLLENTQELSLEEWLEETSSEAAAIAVSSSVGANSLPSLEIETELDDVHTFYVERTGGYVYEISQFNNDIDHRTYFRNLFYEALGEFAVIPFGSGYEVTDLEEFDAPDAIEEDDEEDDEEEEEGTEEIEPEVSYDEAMEYVDDSIAEIAPDVAAVGGTWVVTSYEFVDPYYVYVVYEDGHDLRRVLLQYGVGPGFDYEVLAYFHPGETTDWDKQWGGDDAAGMEKTVFNTGNEAEPIQVMEGYRSFESAPYGFSMQYPSSWYYSGGGGHYSFSDTAEGAELIGLDILDENITNQSGTSFGLPNGKGAKEVESDGIYGVYIDKDGETAYYIGGSSSYKDTILDMAGSILD